jgi:hypothetical protein
VPLNAGKIMASDNKKAETGSVKKSEPTAKEAVKSEPAAKGAVKSEAAAKNKTPAAETPPKAEAAEPAAAPSSYSRGEGQKPVTRAYKENWNAIFAKKSAKKKSVKKKAMKKKR